MKDLEERVVSLEQQTKDRDAENAALKQLLEKRVHISATRTSFARVTCSLTRRAFHSLQSENARLKVYETAFTFDYDKDVSGSSAMSQSTAFRPPQSGSSSPSDALGTSQSSTSFRFESVDSTTSSVSTSRVDSPVLFASTSSDVKPSPRAFDNPTPPTTSSDASDSLFLSSFVNPSPSPFTSFSNLPVASPEALSGDVFKAYRDPLASLGMPSSDLSTFADLDALLAGPSANLGLPASSAALSPATEETLAAFLNPSPPSAPVAAGERSFPSSLHASPVSSAIASASSTAPTTATPSYASDFGLGNLGHAGSPTCPMSSALATAAANGGADALAKLKGQFDPNGKFEFDLDGLCSECVPRLVLNPPLRLSWRLTLFLPVSFFFPG